MQTDTKDRMSTVGGERRPHARRTVIAASAAFVVLDAAWQKDNPDAPYGAPNGYYIINDNPKLRRLPVADDIAVTVLDWNAGYLPLVVAFADLPTELTARGQYPRRTPRGQSLLADGR